MSHLQVVKPDDDSSTRPIDTELRAMIERVIARKPVAVLIIYETADDYDLDHVPRYDSTRRGLTDWLVKDGSVISAGDSDADTD